MTLARHNAHYAGLFGETTAIDDVVRVSVAIMPDHGFKSGAGSDPAFHRRAVGATSWKPEIIEFNRNRQSEAIPQIFNPDDLCLQYRQGLSSPYIR